MLRTPVRRSVLLVAALATGCTSAVRVRSDGRDQDGLPFYLRSMVYRQHTTYEYPWLRVSLSIAPVQPPLGTGTAERVGPSTTLIRDVQDNGDNRAKIDALQQRVSQLPATPLPSLGEAIRGIQADFAAIPRLPADHLAAPAAAALRRSGNYIERVPVVDYSRVYYLNADVPPFGSNNFAAELAADGTLAKGSAAATGGVGEAIGAVASAVTGVLPIKEVLTAKWVPTKSDSSSAANKSTLAAMSLHGIADPATLSFRVELAVEPQAVVVDFTRDHATLPADSTLEAIKADFATGTFTMRPADEPAEKPADGGISFTGSIKLPEAKKP